MLLLLSLDFANCILGALDILSRMGLSSLFAWEAFCSLQRHWRGYVLVWRVRCGKRLGRGDAYLPHKVIKSPVVCSAWAAVLIPAFYSAGGMFQASSFCRSSLKAVQSAGDARCHSLYQVLRWLQGDEATLKHRAGPGAPRMGRGALGMKPGGEAC